MARLFQHNISPLHVAAKWGKNNMVKILLENSAQIDAKTRDGLTPLHCAARSGHEQVVSTLLENSAPISARTKVTTLLTCVRLKRFIIIFIYIKNKSQINIK